MADAFTLPICVFCLHKPKLWDCFSASSYLHERVKGEQGIRITKRHKRKHEQARQYLCSMLMDLMGLLTVTDNAPPSPGLELQFCWAAELNHGYMMRYVAPSW